MDDLERQKIRDALVKVLIFAVGLGLVLALIIFGAVHLLGLGKSKTEKRQAEASQSPLPTVAVSTGHKDKGKEKQKKPTKSASPSDEAKGDIELNAQPAQAAAGQRVNLVGTAKNLDNEVLQVQRRDAGGWVPFAGVSARVQAGKFATYIITTRSGKSQFRVFDPKSQKGSKPVTVTIG